MKTIRNYIILLILVLTSSNTTGFENKEFTYKAVFIERFTRFIDWPDKNTANNDELFAITVLGENPITNELKKIANYQQVKNKRIVIKTITNFTSNLKTNIIFVPAEHKDEIERIVEAVQNKPILVISEVNGAANAGVHINFFIENNKLRFEVNERAVAESGLTMSYLLLKSARIVNPRK